MGVREWICQEEPLIRADGASVGVGFRQIAELVRCKDCKWGETAKNCYGEDRIICGNDDTYIDRYITVPTEWYCADGERKEGR